MAVRRDLLLAVLALVGVVAAVPIPPGTMLQISKEEIGSQGRSGGLCPMFVDFVADDGCSTCSCAADGRMTACNRSACPDPGNYTINECVEGALYVGNDGCNRCQCSAFRHFSWCTRRICVEALFTTTPSATITATSPYSTDITDTTIAVRSPSPPPLSPPSPSPLPAQKLVPWSPEDAWETNEVDPTRVSHMDAMGLALKHIES